MGELGAFLKIERRGVEYRDPEERIKRLQGVPRRAARCQELRDQGARCMECGIPFCHNGCPLGNLIPDWNDLVYRDRWFDAIKQLHATNNFPEFTGRLCPAPCEAACVLEIREGDAVTIKQIENSIIDRAWEEGWVKPLPPARRDRLRRRGRRRGPGRHGRRAAAAPRGPSRRAVRARRGRPAGWCASACRTSRSRSASSSAACSSCATRASRSAAASTSASTSPVDELRDEFDAIVLATGSRTPRDLPVPGRELDGVHFAMDYLYGRNRWVADGSYEPPISAAGKNVVVIGGGDTGADCVANADREGARADRPARGAARAAAQAPRRPDAVAAVAAEVPPVVRDGGGRARSARASRTSSSRRRRSPAPTAA